MMRGRKREGLGGDEGGGGMICCLVGREVRKVVEVGVSLFWEEGKGDMIGGMSGEVREVERWVRSWVDMVIKKGIVIIGYLGRLIGMSWEVRVLRVVGGRKKE